MTSSFTPAAVRHALGAAALAVVLALALCAPATAAPQGKTTTWKR